MMKDSKKAQWKTCSVSKVVFSYGYDIKRGNTKKENDRKIKQNKKNRPKGWSWDVINLVSMIVYAVLIFIGIRWNNESLILLGTVFTFCYGLKTSTWFKRFSNIFMTCTGHSLDNKRFVSLVSLVDGLFVFLLESYSHVLANHFPLGILGFEASLMGISLLLLLYDSLKFRTILSDLNPDKINRIEIIQVFQKSSPEDFS